MIENNEKRECPNGCGLTMEQDTMDKPTQRPDGTFFLVRDLPVFQCTECGEISIPVSSVKEVENLIESNQDPDEVSELPVYHVKAS